MNKKRLKVMVGMICIAGLLLPQCRQEPASVVQTPTATAAPTGTPAPTATPTEGEKAAEAAAQQFVPEYFPNGGECHQVVAEGKVAECMYPGPIQNIMRPEWQLLFPDTDFYLIRLDAYHPEDVYGAFSSRTKLIAWQNGEKYEAGSFDKLLVVNNIALTDDNYELIAQAFALLTLKEYITEEVVFTHWVPIDVQNAYTHYDARLQAWTKLGGLEIEWYFGTESQTLNIVTGPWVSNSRTGDFISYSKLVIEGHGLTSSDYVLVESK